MSTEKKKPSADEVAKIIAAAHKRYDRYVDHHGDNLSEAHTDLQYLRGEQWKDTVKKDRETANRPVLTHNLILPYHRKMCGDIFINKPKINIAPATQATVEDARIMQGMTKAIERESRADSIYGNSFERMSGCSMSYFRIVQEQEPRSFDQRLRIKDIPDTFCVAYDPDCTEPDGSDAKWVIISESITHDEFKARYPGKEIPTGAVFADNKREWVTSDSVIIAEYWTRKEKTARLLELSDGTIKYESELEAEGLLPEGVEITRERDDKRYEVKQYIFGGEDLLEDPYTWPGQFIPVIREYGPVIVEDGKEYLQSAIRSAREPQRYYNLMISSKAEHVGRSPKQLWEAEAEMIEGYEAQYANPNSTEGVLYYKSVNGNKPNLLSPPPIPQGLMEESLTAAADVERTMGMFRDAMGAQTNAGSGIAIRQRQSASEVTVYAFTESHHRAIAYCGRILVDAIPYFYDTARMVTIVGNDDKEENVPINQPFNEQMMNGVKQMIPHDLGQKRFDVADTKKTYTVSVTAGPGMATQRQDAAELMRTIMQSLPPNLAAALAPAVVEMQDFAGAEQYAAVLKKTLPPGLYPPKPGDEPPAPPPPSPEVQLKQLDAQIKQMDAESERIKAQAAIITAQANLEKAKMGAEDMTSMMRRVALEVMQEAHAESHPADMLQGPEPAPGVPAGMMGAS